MVSLKPGAKGAADGALVHFYALCVLYRVIRVIQTILDFIYFCKIVVEVLIDICYF